MAEVTLNVWTLVLLLGAYTFLAGGTILNLVQTGQIEVSIFNNNDWDNYTGCQDKDLRGTTSCLVDYVDTFYNFTPTEDIPQSFESLKENGGDCYDYSILYKDMATSLGYNAKTVLFYGEDMGHQITLVWDDNIDTYCLIDQQVSACVDLGDYEE